MTETATAEPAAETPASVTELPAPPPTAEVAIADPTRGALMGASIDARIRYARELANAGLLPRDYRRQPANVLYAVEYGNMLGVHPLAAVTGIHVIDGKPTASPALMSALVRKAGHRLRVGVEGVLGDRDLFAWAEVVRSDDPGFTFRAEWNLDRALAAELVDRLDTTEDGRTLVVAQTEKHKAGSWQKHTVAMLKARAIGEVCREACEDVLCGAHYTPEELGAIVDGEGEVIEGEVVSTLIEPAEPDRPAGPSPKVAEALRDRILAASTLDDLVKLWTGLGEQVDRGEASVEILDVEVGTADGQALTIRSLFDLRGKQIKGETDPPPGGGGGGSEPPAEPATPTGTPEPGPESTGGTAGAAEPAAEPTPTTGNAPLDAPLPTDRLTEAERAAYARFGGHRAPYVGSGLLGCLRSAVLDTEEAMRLGATDERREWLEASALAWGAQAELEEQEGTNGPETPARANARASRAWVTARAAGIGVRRDRGAA